MTIWYTKTHQWYNDENGEVGLTPFAAEQLGEISFVDVDALEGAARLLTERKIQIDGIFAYNVVKEVNGDLMDEPEKINEAAFSAWLYKIDASNWDAEKGNLLDEAAYKAFTDSLK